MCDPAALTDRAANKKGRPNLGPAFNFFARSVHVFLFVRSVQVFTGVA